MTTLDNIIGNILHEINLAKTKSDYSTLQIAKIYGRNPILQHFPIPRMTIDDIELDLNFAIKSIGAEDTKPDDKGQKPTPSQMQLLLTATELETISPEKIQHLKIKIKSSDRELSHEMNEQGERVAHLSPK